MARTSRRKPPLKPSSAGPIGRDLGRGAQRREAIVEAAVRVIARDGVRGATHRAVAAEADVPLAATTYYFASRSDLVADAFRHLAEQQIDELAAGARQLPARMSAELAAAVLASAVADDLRLHRERIRAEHELALEAGREPTLRALHSRWAEAALAFFATAVRAAGSPRPELDAAIVLAIISGIELGELADPQPQLEREILGPMLRRVLHALIAAP
ncbi:MAG: TetR/AcrR family transcriptional regulator [Kofleriaceae bacterium]